VTLEKHRHSVAQSLADLLPVYDCVNKSRAGEDRRFRRECCCLVVNGQERRTGDRKRRRQRLVRMNHGVHSRARFIDRSMDHRFPWRNLELGNFAFVPSLGPVLLAGFLVFVDIHFDDVFNRDGTERRQHRLYKEVSRAWDSRADMTMVISQTLIEHDAVAERDFFL